jgi:hypothetical protein
MGGITIRNLDGALKSRLRNPGGGPWPIDGR